MTGRRCDLLVTGGLLLASPGSGEDPVAADLAVSGGEIVGLGAPGGWQADEVVDASGCVVLPGFVDGHRHMFSSLLRGCAVNASYQDYFQRIVLTYGRGYAPEDTEVAVELATAEALNAGITSMHAWEHNLLTVAHAEAAVGAFVRSGLRGRFSYGPPNDPVEIDRAGLLETRSRWFPRRQDGRWLTEDGLVHLGLATRAVEFGLPDVWRSELAFGRSEGLPVTAHCSGGAVRALAEAGELREGLLPIHADHADAEEIAMLASSGLVLCVAPVALARAGIGRSPLTEAVAAGIELSLSIDSTAGCDSTDMFQVMRTAMLVERAVHERVDGFTPEHALRAATTGGALALGLSDQVGTLEVGKRADVVVVRVDGLNMAPANVPAHLLVLAATARDVDAVIVDGRIRKRAGRLTDIDVPGLLARAGEAVERLSARAGAPVH